VPLSEHEQRVLRQIERQFQAERALPRSIEVDDGPDDDARRAKRSALGFALGLVALLVSFASSWVVGVIGFVAMVLCAVRFVQAARRLLVAQLERLGPGLARRRRPANEPAPTLFSQLRRALWGGPGSAPGSLGPSQRPTLPGEHDGGADQNWEA
jgi:hypothetical protein